MNERTLEFEVISQRLKKKRGCSFFGIVTGSINYLRAKFHFSDEWDDCIKIVTFASKDNPDISVAVRLDENNSCFVPKEISDAERFSIFVLGGKADYRISTNSVSVKQKVVD